MNLQKGFSSPSEGTYIAALDTHLYVCGRNNYFQLGQDTQNAQSFSFLPLSLPTTSPLKMLAAGQCHFLALTEDGDVFVWGSNADSRLGLGEDEKLVKSPVRLPLTRKQTFVTCGPRYSVCIQDDGSILIFGTFTYASEEPKPTDPVVLPSKPVQAACGWDHFLFLTEDKCVYSCGGNSQGQLGLGHFDDQLAPKKVIFPGDPKISAIACSMNYDSYSMALSKDGKVYTWGCPRDGRLGLGAGVKTHQKTPCVVSEIPEPVHAIATGAYHAMALTSSGSIYIWGNNGNGQLGLPSRYVFSPSLLPLPSKISSIACGSCHSVAFGIDGEIFLWGMNLTGALGITGKNNIYEPTLLPPTTWKSRTLWQDEIWKNAGKWIFLGRESATSELSRLPVEVIFHFVMSVSNL
jgi:alpha-tubulin suppressor-like RCC1 family protein